jgi:hypothetical protein
MAVSSRSRLIRETKVSDGLSPGGGRHHFFEAISFNIALSSIASAKSLFSLAFSSSNDFRHLASDTSSPPFPARMARDLEHLRSSIGSNLPINLEPTLYLLAAGKIVVIGGFVFMLRNVSDGIEEPRFWPEGYKPSPYPVQHLVLALVAALGAPLILEWGKEVIARTLSR